MRKQRCISVDIPWPEQGGGRIKRGADRHYKCIKKSQCPHEAIRIIYQSGVWNPDPRGCHGWIWVTSNFLEDGLFVMKALGFRYVNKLTWGKVKNGNVQKGLGQYFFGSDEICLFGVMGRLRAQQRVPTFFTAERDQHSRKPDEAYRLMEMVSPGPRLELFARRPRRNWQVWGDQVRIAA